MINWYRNGLRFRVLGVAAVGLILPSFESFGQSNIVSGSAKKKSAVKPAAASTIEPPRLLSSTNDSDSTTNVIRPVSQLELAADDKSEVQRQLEALYEQDGREMPVMNMKLQPISPQNGQPQQSSTAIPSTSAATNQTKSTTPQKPVRPAQGYNQYQPKPTATPYTSQPNPQAPRNFSSAIAAQNTPQTTQAPPTPQRRNAVTGFFKRVTGQTKPPTNQAPIPPDYNNAASVAKTSTGVPGVPPASAVGTATPSSTQTAMKYYTPPKSTAPSTLPGTPPTLATTNSKPLPLQPSNNVQTIANTSSMGELPQPTLSMPPLSDQPLPPLIVVAVPTSLPPLMSDVQAPVAPTKPVSQQEKLASSAGEGSIDFPNPFSEVPEHEADVRVTRSPKRSAPSASLPDLKPTVVAMPESKPELKVEPQRESSNESTVVRSDDDPYAVTAKDFAEPTIRQQRKPQPAAGEFVPPKIAIKPEVSASTDSEERPELNPQSTGTPLELEAPSSQTAPEPIAPELALPDLTAPELSAPALSPPELTAPQLTPPSVDNSKNEPELKSNAAPQLKAQEKVVPPVASTESHIEKMRRIRERFGMKGLKGFCPVTLYEERELVDARPEFHFTHRSQKFHFASAEARNKFEADPVRYAPAAYGADVVALTRDKDVVEGTLDFAAWYKGRLYLFGSQENYDLFIANPTKFASLSGIE